MRSLEADDSPRASSRSRALVLVALSAEAIGLLALLLLGAPDPLVLGQRWFQLAVLSTGGVIGWTLTLVRPHAVDTRVVIALFVCVLAVAIPAAFSPYPSMGWSGTWASLGTTGTFLLLYHQASSPTGRKDLLALVVMVFLVLALAYLATVAAQWVEWLQRGMGADTLPLRPGNRGGLVAIPTWLGDALVTTGPVAALTILAPRRLNRLAACTLVAIGLVALVLTGTRSLWLIAIAGAFVVAIGAGVFRRQIVLAASLSVVAAILLLFLTGGAVQTGRDVDAGRTSAFGSAVRLFAERPLLGGGPGTYGIWRLDDPIPVFDHRAFPTAHNVILNTGAETGLVGLVLVAVAAGLIGVTAVRALTGEDRLIRVGALAGAFMATAHAMVDVLFEHPGLLVLVLGALAIAIAPSARRGAPTRSVISRRLAVPLIAVVSVAGVGTGRLELAVASTVRASEASAGYTLALEEARRAVQLAPDFGPAWLVAGWAADRAGATQEALDLLRSAASIDPLPQHQASVAVLADRLGHPDEALRAMLDAASLDQADPVLQLNATVMLAASQGHAESIRTFGHLIIAEPLITTVAETVPISAAGRGEAERFAIDHLVKTGRRVDALLVALSSSGRIPAGEVLRSFGHEEREFGEAILSAWEGVPGSRTRVDEIARLSPARPRGLWAAWYFAAIACDGASAEDWARLHAIQFGVYPRAPLAVGPAPAFGDRLFPVLYPQAVWRIRIRTPTYVNGVWTVRYGTPACADALSG